MYKEAVEKQIMLAFEQNEKKIADLQQRTKNGLQTPKLNGKTLGHRAVTKITTKKKCPAKATILKYSKDFNSSLNDGKAIGISRNTYYKYKTELRKR